MQEDVANKNEKDSNVKLLEVSSLKTQFKLSNGSIIKAVDGLSFSLEKGQVLGIIGESGSGKSVTSRSIMRIVEKPGYIADGKILFKGQDLLSLPENEMNRLRGSKMSLIFQDPTTSLNPFMTIGDHMSEAYKAHKKSAKKDEINDKILQVLKMAGISDGNAILKKYPCEFSAGFRQRIFIALSMILDPELLIADEPTTSLGITIQAEIIEALKKVQLRTGVGIIIITHDFGVVSQFSNDILVMYAGKCVEYSPKKDLLLSPKHPYTVGLLRSVPILEERKSKRLKSIEGFPPDMENLPEGCSFSSRCEYAKDICFKKSPELRQLEGKRACACHFDINYKTSEDTELE